MPDRIWGEDSLPSLPSGFPTWQRQHRLIASVVGLGLGVVIGLGLHSPPFSCLLLLRLHSYPAPGLSEQCLQALLQLPTSDDMHGWIRQDLFSPSFQRPVFGSRIFQGLSKCISFQS